MQYVLLAAIAYLVGNIAKNLYTVHEKDSALFVYLLARFLAIFWALIALIILIEQT